MLSDFYRFTILNVLLLVQDVMPLEYVNLLTSSVKITDAATHCFDVVLPHLSFHLQADNGIGNCLPKAFNLHTLTAMSSCRPIKLDERSSGSDRIALEQLQEEHSIFIFYETPLHVSFDCSGHSSFVNFNYKRSQCSQPCGGVRSLISRETIHDSCSSCFHLQL